MLTAFAVLLCVTAVLAYLNERLLKLPTTVGVTLSGALASAALIGLDALGLIPGVRHWAATLLQTLNFTEFVLNGILSLLLFAGSLSLDAAQMLRQRGSILLLAFLSTLISTFLIGFAAYGLFRVLGLDVPLLWALLFGALISPTDPVAVLDLLKRARVPARIETLIAGESLFNDGVGVVIFLVVAAVAGIGPHGTHQDVTVLSVLGLFVREALGGLLFGALLGGLGAAMVRTIDQRAVEVLITLALVVGGYVAAAALGTSGPLAMVVAGLVMSAAKRRVFSEEARHHVEGFWETVDQVLNIVLFAFIGLDVLLTRPSTAQVVASVLMVGVALAARYVSVALPFALVRAREGYGAYTVRLLTWGGLRGGIAISLALGLPDSPYRPLLLTATYAVVLFTIAVQGLTILPLVRRASDATPAESKGQRAESQDH
ncbi:CPA1 family monovalent cation:H+ antiporter [Deinococcus metalli]|uniref:CPA1 family monovalent cation:H+ antiporter n=1 Tax=Deinococcus metalli TaxID=1141878 RepID=A0A7W8KEA1_9DEIO|nr:sodium:proton antiporter [Deinococcus metalli]MBB5376153.1 CPA1 family monovalent cation:H+ antiporter [Deinococcus metalli]GHF40400.1 sodium:proton antiporter [Deinococcus metalli]